MAMGASVDGQLDPEGVSGGGVLSLDLAAAHGLVVDAAVSKVAGGPDCSSAGEQTSSFAVPSPLDPGGDSPRDDGGCASPQ